MKAVATAILVAWIRICATYWGVDPDFALAVAHIESRIGNKEFRIGRLGRSKYFGPFGIHECFLRQPIGGVVYRIDEWPVNVYIGCRALRGKSEKKVLKRYNAEFSRSYWKAIQLAKNKYKKKYKTGGSHGKPTERAED